MMTGRGIRVGLRDTVAVAAGFALRSPASRTASVPASRRLAGLLLLICPWGPSGRAPGHSGDCGWSIETRAPAAAHL